jgi:hypothetical protein
MLANGRWDLTGRLKGCRIHLQCTVCYTEWFVNTDEFVCGIVNNVCMLQANFAKSSVDSSVRR